MGLMSQKFPGLVNAAIGRCGFPPNLPEGPYIYYNMCFLVHLLVWVNSRVASPPIQTKSNVAMGPSKPIGILEADGHVLPAVTEVDAL